jgi:hypothetical protein
MSATQLPEHIARRIEMMALTPTPSCQALKKALVDGLALRVPSLLMDGRRAYICSAVGKATRAYNFEELPLCPNCLDVDVWPYDGMTINTLWYWPAGGKGAVRSWQISAAVNCDCCRRLKTEQTMNRECPVCLEAFTTENPAKGPSISGYPSDCPHCICEACGDQLCVNGPPFQCPICRRDYTQWFVDEFCYTPPPPLEELRRLVFELWPHFEATAAVGLMEAALEILHQASESNAPGAASRPQ